MLWCPWRCRVSDCGTPPGYQQHIAGRTEPCTPCRAAHAAQRADYRRRRYLNHGPLLVDATGTRRRLEALAAIGWPAHELGRRLGISASTIRGTGVDYPHCTTATRDKVAALYDDLSMTLGPSLHARTWARKRGWLPPLCWDDADIDNPAAKPYKALRTTGTPASRDPEIVAEIVRLTGFGLSARQIGERVGMSARNVVRIRSLTARNGEREAS